MRTEENLPLDGHVDHLGACLVLRLTTKPALLEDVLSAVQLHLHLLLHLIWHKPLEKYLLVPLHNWEEVESTVAIL